MSTLKISTLFLLCGVLLGAIPGVVSAQTIGTGSGLGSGVGIPQGFSIPTIQNWDRGDDAIVQLNNLTIQSVSGNMVYASRNYSNGCLGFASPQSSGRSIACPMISPNALYQISVGGDTILLLRNRERASLGTFAAGDHINVFGFLDQNSQLMQALILRDLDKPSPQSVSYYAQFNNVRAVTAPSYPVPQVPGGITSSFDIVFSPAPCALYSGPQGYRLPATCPYVPQAPSGVFMLAKHTVNILTDQTVILDQFRQTMPLSAIQAGDTLNVFGRYDPATGNIDAVIIRDLSSNGTISNGSGTLRVTVVNQSIQCIMAPCGRVPGVVVQLSAQGSVIPGAVISSGTTDQNGQAVFPNLPAGAYLVQVLNANAPVQNVFVQSGILTETTVYMNGSLPGPFAAPQIYSLVPQSGVPGAVVTLSGAGFTPTGNIVHFAMNNGLSAYLPNLSSPNGSVLSFTVPSFSSIACEYANPRCYPADSQLPSGIYSVWVENGNGISNQAQFTLTAATNQQPPQIFSIVPQNGTIGNAVTINGTGFTPDGNRIIFGQYQAAVATSNGSSLSFIVPSYMGANCAPNQACEMFVVQMQSGQYAVHIENVNGISNNLNFQVY